MKKNSALIVEDDYIFAKILSQHLQSEGYNCSLESDIPSVVHLIEEGPRADIYILDYELGDNITGLDLCRLIKSREPRSPVVMLTGFDSEEVAVRCLDAGADQFLLKPYKKSELFARMRTALRTCKVFSGRESPKRITGVQSHEMCIPRRCFTAGTQQMKLTGMESLLFEYLLGNVGMELRRETLHSTIYGYQPDIFSRKIDVLIGRIKKKLEGLGTPYLINNVWGYGYIMYAAPTTSIGNSNGN